jgi:hypothetical protein
MSLEISDPANLKMSVAAIREMLDDVRVTTGKIPRAIYMNPMDAGDIRNELNDHGTDADNAVIAVIYGAPVLAHPDVSRGTVRLL